jgi:tRNA A-37 threonylcarbamoyl transferase component Bud32
MLQSPSESGSQSRRKGSRRRIDLNNLNSIRKNLTKIEFPPEPVQESVGLAAKRGRPRIQLVSQNEEISTNIFLKMNKLRNMSSQQHRIQLGSEDLYTEFMNDLSASASPKLYLSTNDEILNIPKIKHGQFGKIYILQVSGHSKYIIKEIPSQPFILHNQQNPEVEAENIQYMNQKMSEHFIIKQLIFRNTSNGSIYFVSKYLHGYTSLDSFLSTLDLKNKEDKRKLNTLLHHIKSAFDEMNTSGIIHKDAHLHNIMINQSNLEIKFVDYGICDIRGSRTFGTKKLLSFEEFNKSLLDAKKRFIVSILNKFSNTPIQLSRVGNNHTNEIRRRVNTLLSNTNITYNTF